jgi:GST-like protein
MMIDFYTSPTANCQRVAITLAVLGLQHRAIPVDRAAGEQQRPEFLAVNPAGAVPVIVDRDPALLEPIVLAQSGAILLYLAEKTGRLLPASGPARAVTLHWLMQVLTDVNPAASLLYMATNGLIPDGGPGLAPFLGARFSRFLGHCEAAVAAREYLAGELSVADLALYPVAVGRWADAGIPERFPALAAWAHRIGSVPTVASFLPPPA